MLFENKQIETINNIIKPPFFGIALSCIFNEFLLGSSKIFKRDANLNGLNTENNKANMVIINKVILAKIYEFIKS